MKAQARLAKNCWTPGSVRVAELLSFGDRGRGELVSLHLLLGGEGVVAKSGWKLL